jgi:adenylate cyclase
VNTGPAVIGNVGDGDQRSFAAIGDTTNVAARLQSEALPGQVLASSTTVARLEGAVDSRSVGTRSLKGKGDKVDVYELIGSHA